MSFYPCFWAVLLLTSLVCVALDGVELLKKWAENMKVVIFSVKWGNEWLPHVAKGVGKSAPPFSDGVHFLDAICFAYIGGPIDVELSLTANARCCCNARCCV